VLPRLAYLIPCRSIQLLARTDAARELEILVLAEPPSKGLGLDPRASRREVGT
jgi:hypothetical protein